MKSKGHLTIFSGMHSELLSTEKNISCVLFPELIAISCKCTDRFFEIGSILFQSVTDDYSSLQSIFPTFFTVVIKIVEDGSFEFSDT